MTMELIKKYGQITKPDKMISESFPFGYPEIKDHLVLRVVDTGSNKEGLSGVPHRELLDLSFYAGVEVSVLRRTETLAVTDDLLAHWGISEEVLFNDALESMRSNNKPFILNLQNIIGAPPAEEKKERKPGEGLFVATTGNMCFGAAVLYDREFLKKFRKELQEDFYILPSSVHEVLFYPVSGGMPADQIKDMIRFINKTEVEPEEKLTDSLYRYEAETNRILLVI